MDALVIAEMPIENDWGHSRLWLQNFLSPQASCSSILQFSVDNYRIVGCSSRRAQLPTNCNLWLPQWPYKWDELFECDLQPKASGPNCKKNIPRDILLLFQMTYEQDAGIKPETQNTPCDRCISRSVLSKIMHLVLSRLTCIKLASEYLLRFFSILFRPVSVSDKSRRSSAHIRELRFSLSVILTGRVSPSFK